MHRTRRLRHPRSILFVLTALLLAASVAGYAGAAPRTPKADGDSGTHRVKKLSGVRPTPNLPLGSLIRRPDVAAHHFGQGRPPRCDKDINTAPTGDHISGVDFVAALDTGICTNADLDVWQVSDGATQSFVAQAGGEEAAFNIIDVSDPANPVSTTFVWNPRRVQLSTFTPDVKAFKQGTNRYLALALERTKVRGACGVVIVNVTNPATPMVVSQFIGLDWCDSHNVFVETDGSGDGAFIHAVADVTEDMRVLDIGSVTNPVEVGGYTHPCVADPSTDGCPPTTVGGPPGPPFVSGPEFFVHDITVQDGVVYVSYWDAGLDIVDASAMQPGHITTAENPMFSIDPDGFLNHHAVPDTGFVFIQDEITFQAPFEPVQMWDISDLSNPAYVDGLPPGQGVGSEELPAHNLLVLGDTLYVGWYKAGLQAFGFDANGFTGRVAHHQVQTEPSDDPYSGAWAVRHLGIGGEEYVFQSDRNYGLIVDMLP